MNSGRSVGDEMGRVETRHCSSNDGTSRSFALSFSKLHSAAARVLAPHSPRFQSCALEAGSYASVAACAQRR
jgi:hypothetical protein